MPFALTQNNLIENLMLLLEDEYTERVFHCSK